MPVDGPPLAAGAPGRPRSAAAPPLAWSSSERSSSDASASAGSNSWRTTPNANSRSSSAPRDRSTRIPWSTAVVRAAASNAVFPIPAGPSTTKNLPPPAHASASADSIRASSCRRSSSGLAVASLRTGRVFDASRTVLLNTDPPLQSHQRRGGARKSRRAAVGQSGASGVRSATARNGRKAGRPVMLVRRARRPPRP